MATTWIVTADSSRARFLQVADREGKLVEVDHLENPQGRMQDRDLQTDAEPRFNGHGGVGRAGSAPTGGPASDRETQGAAEHSVTVFAKEIGRYLEQARHEHRYDELVLVAPPKFLGAVRGELGKEVQKMVVEALPKDVSHFSARELERYFDRGS